MQVALLATLVFFAFAWVFYSLAGRRIAGRMSRRAGDRDRMLARKVRQTFWVFLAGSLVVFSGLLLSGPRLSASLWAVLIYALPLLWSWVLVLGSSHLEMCTRGLGAGLWRFHRFNLFAAFMLRGQRIPFYSAAIAAPNYVLRGADPLVTAGLHLAVAVGLGWGVRFLLLNVIVGVRPYPDARLAVEVRAAARAAGIRLRGVMLVPTEPGQSVNAVAATSSRIVYVAEGMWRGLEREELRAVLLHEVGHLGQPFTNAFRNISVLGWPAIVGGASVAVECGGSLLRAGVALFMLVLLGLGGSHLSETVTEDSERRADLFAERTGTPGALASALRKIYEGGHYRETGGRRRRGGARMIQQRLQVLD